MDFANHMEQGTPTYSSTISNMEQFLFIAEDRKVKDERNWYRCTTREEMVLLIAAGFDYTNFRADKYNNGNNTYFFERTEKLNKFLEMRQLQ